MDRMVAYCGLVCTDCPAYVATQADDRAALERMAEQARAKFNAPDITVESVACDGCLASDGRLGGYCLECQVRACGIERGVINCAYCDEYACDELGAFLGGAPGARATLDGIRAGLAA
jgi:hypothetical protein